MNILEIAFECLVYRAMEKIICAAFVIWGRIFMRRETRNIKNMCLEWNGRSPGCRVPPEVTGVQLPHI